LFNDPLASSNPLWFADIKESFMSKQISLVFVLLIALGLSACSAPPPLKAVPGPEAQRSHAHEAQDELSSEVHK
jgi:starvation-inducible outer membrane lipoprotein